jgi:hypothetical protein
MFDGSQGIHPLESHPSQMSCVASATLGFAETTLVVQEEYRIHRHGIDYDEWYLFA